MSNPSPMMSSRSGHAALILHINMPVLSWQTGSAPCGALKVPPPVSSPAAADTTAKSMFAADRSHQHRIGSLRGSDRRIRERLTRRVNGAASHQNLFIAEHMSVGLSNLIQNFLLPLLRSPVRSRRRKSRLPLYSISLILFSSCRAGIRLVLTLVHY